MGTVMYVPTPGVAGKSMRNCAFAGATTVTRAWSDFLALSAEVAVIVAVPGAIPVTSPDSLTVAIEGALLDQIISELVAWDGFTVAVNWPDSLTTRESLSLSSFTLPTGIDGWPDGLSVAAIPIPLTSA
ncbi:hypothetical protein GCM10010911_54100 [Paenibacillus nasutitermitis]|uniref:Uncharacterized protein n=1 Tax=Paenibacillus nasutitermitis TaxID=1652958 RepID=A0A916ZCU0_9BACL|nr:hypothetical protein [Paenibacillus nasutitermitis]GGD88695.1 hypothetical protein GCM10010911_54100 [Paenibacillus nasutitermitis]